MILTLIIRSFAQAERQVYTEVHESLINNTSDETFESHEPKMQPNQPKTPVLEIDRINDFVIIEHSTLLDLWESCQETELATVQCLFAQGISYLFLVSIVRTVFPIMVICFCINTPSENIKPFMDVKCEHLCQ